MRFGFMLAALLGGCLWTNQAAFQFGVAAVDISPEEPIWLSGYAARTNVAEKVAQRLFTKAIAIRQNDNETALILTVDNCGLSKEIRDAVVGRVGKEHAIPSERIVIFNSHTHAAPCLSNALPHLFIRPISEADLQPIHRYTARLIDRMAGAASAAIGNLKPGMIYYAQGQVGFAKNRRTEGGPVDHDLPILVFKDEEQKVRGVLANYACHCTTAGTFNEAHGDWAGFAQAFIAEDLPGAIGLVSIGCGADANPHPRGMIDLARTHGRELADEVGRLLKGPLVELTKPLEFRAESFDLPFDPLPTLEEWEKRAEQAEPPIVGYHARINLERIKRGESLPTALPYQVQTWNFGDQLALVFLPGEVVVDYALRLKREFDGERLWVSGYANWVPCYIPSERILREGGYEAETSLWYYDWPARLSPRTESLIIESVHRLLPKGFLHSGTADPQ